MDMSVQVLFHLDICRKMTASQQETFYLTTNKNMEDLDDNLKCIKGYQTCFTQLEIMRASQICMTYL